MVIAHLNAPLAFNIKARKKLTFHCNQWNEKTASLGLSWSNEELAHNSVVVYWNWFWWKLHVGKEVRATYLSASRTDGIVNQIKLKFIIDQIVQGHLKLGHGIGTYQMPNKLKCNEEVGFFFNNKRVRDNWITALQTLLWLTYEFNTKLADQGHNDNGKVKVMDLIFKGRHHKAQRL